MIIPGNGGGFDLNINFDIICSPELKKEALRRGLWSCSRLTWHRDRQIDFELNPQKWAEIVKIHCLFYWYL